MQLTSAPAKLVEAWAVNGSKNNIPVPSQISITPGAASWNDGFPPLTMTPVPDGGIPPDGLDMNGGLFGISAPLVWLNAGGAFQYDSVFSAAIGGYPKGARLLNAAGTGFWLSSVDNNTTDPDTGGAGWVAEGSSYTSSVYANAQQNLSSGSYPASVKIVFNTVEFDSGIWNSGSNHFTAPFAGIYKISGSILLSAPPGQELGIQIAKNGSIVKQCCQFPQTTDQNLSMPFSALIQCAATDYLDVYLYMGQSGVSVGLGGSNQLYVFAQCEFLGS